MATTQQETDNRPSRSGRLPRLRKIAQSKIAKITLTILVIGTILLVFPRVAPMLISPINGGTIFGVALTLACLAIIRDHHRLRSTNKKQLIMWPLYAFIALYATVVLSYYDNRVDPFMGHLALFPLLALMVIAFYLGILYVIRFRKHEDATYTGYLYLLAATLTTVVTMKLAMWFGPEYLYFYGEYHQSIIALFLLAVCLLMFALARRPDLVYDEDETPDPSNNISSATEREVYDYNTDDGNNPGHPDTSSFLEHALTDNDPDQPFYDPRPTDNFFALTSPLPAHPPTQIPPENASEITTEIKPIREPQPAQPDTTPNWPSTPPEEYSTQRGRLTPDPQQH